MAEANAEQREQWNGEGGRRWVADADRRDRALAPVLDVLLDAAALQPGERVLDVGCGCGVTTLAAADRTGRATGLDLSGPMLDVARERAAGQDHVEFLQADAQTHPFDATYDVVIGRFGTMFFDDPVAAHANLRAAVSLGGRLCLATWQVLERNDWLLVPAAVLVRHGSVPEAPPGPGMFAQAEPSTVERVLTEAGWSGITVEPVTVEMVLDADPADAVDYLADTGIVRRILDTIPEANRSAALDELSDVLGTHTTDAVRLNGGINVIRAGLLD